MPYITLQDAKSIWFKTPRDDWRSFYDVLLQQYNEENDELDQNEADLMLRVVSRLQQERVPFPRTYKELFDVLNYWAAQ